MNHTRFNLMIFLMGTLLFLITAIGFRLAEAQGSIALVMYILNGLLASYIARYILDQLLKTSTSKDFVTYRQQILVVTIFFDVLTTFLFEHSIIIVVVTAISVGVYLAILESFTKTRNLTESESE